MVIEQADRFGLAQLHQLRGRVGRGAEPVRCVLLYKPPLSAKPAGQRLKALRETQDGFRIAEQDLKLRGPGELLGTRQTGALRCVSPTSRATPTCWSASRRLPTACSMRTHDRWSS